MEPLLSPDIATAILLGALIGSLIGTGLAYTIEWIANKITDYRMKRGFKEARKRGWI